MDQISSPAATGNTGNGNPATGTKKRRVQYTSCDACRLRKTKCERDEGSESCRGCASKSIACTSTFVRQHQGGKGKRLDEARKIFGSTCTKASATQPGQLLLQPHTGPSQALAKQVDLIQLSPAAQEALSPIRLFRLIHTHKADIDRVVCTTDFDRLLEACVAARFDITKMDDLDRILCVATAAVAKSVQLEDPNNAEVVLRCSDQGVITDELIDYVMTLVDRAGVLRDPTPRGLEILRLLLFLTSTYGIMEFKRAPTYRSYEAVFVEHLRHLSDSRQIPPNKAVMFFYTTIIGDSFGCAASGQVPIYTDDDIDNFTTFTSSDTATILKNISSCDPKNADVGFDLLIGPLCMLARSLNAQVTSPRARRRGQINLDVLRDVIPVVQRTVAMNSIYEQRLAVIFPTGIPDHLDLITKLIRFFYTTLPTLALDELEAAMLDEASTSASWERIAELQTLFSSLQTFYADMMANGAARQASVPVNHVKVLSRADAFLSYLSTKRVARIIKIPTIEEGQSFGYPAPWSIADKATIARKYLTVHKHITSLVPSIAAELSSLETSVQKLEAKARLMSMQNQPTFEIAQDVVDPSNWYPSAGRLSDPSNPSTAGTEPPSAFLKDQIPTGVLDSLLNP